MNFHARLRPEPIGFQLAPMIDVVFLLLCFFMTSQLFAQWETDVPLTLPTARTGETSRRLPGEITLNITADGRVIVNAKPYTDEELARMLERLAKLYPGQPVVLRADRSTPYEQIIRVLDLCRQSDIWNISFATLPPSR
ncbi:MAG: biopolymer transporter ExbD [Kiritimatiellae bacterium]|nr:biopolymer transporter ExbD [Kiritimatiellia bacterium]